MKQPYDNHMRSELTGVESHLTRPGTHRGSASLHLVLRCVEIRQGTEQLRSATIPPPGTQVLKDSDANDFIALMTSWRRPTTIAVTNSLYVGHRDPTQGQG